MKFFSDIKREAKALTAPLTLIGLGGGFLAALITLIACGNLYLYSFLLLPRHAPPAFLFFFVFLLMTALLGGCAGMMRCRRCFDPGWAGSLFPLFSALFLLLWYIAFMRSSAFVFALIMLLCAGVMIFFALGEAYEREAAIVLIAEAVCALLILMLLWLTVSVILLN